MKKYICLFLCVISVVLLSGCWSSREPKNFAYVDSAVFNKNTDDMYKVTVCILNPPGMGGAGSLGGGGGGKNPYVTFTGTGPSLREAITKQSESREMIDFGALAKVFFLSEKYAQGKANMMSLLDMGVRGGITDEKPLLVVIEGDYPEKIYSAMFGISGMAGDYVDNLSKHQPKDMSKGVFVNGLEFLRDYYTEGKEPVTGMISIVESTDVPSGNTMTTTSGKNPVNYQIRYRGLAAFRNGGFVGFMDEYEAQAYNFLVNKVKSAFITVPAGETGSTVIHIVQSKADIKANVSDGKAVIDIKIKAGAEVAQEGDALDVTKPGDIKTIEESLKREMERQIQAAVEKAQKEFRSDIFGFGQSLHIQHPDIWKKVESEWNNYFANAKISVTFKSGIAATGKIEQPIAVEGNYQ